MDGIAGIIYADVFQMSNGIEPMLNIMAHRGEMQEICTIKNVQLGSCGKPIASNADKSLFAALDGTLLNEKELREELNTSGSGAEMVLAAYHKWGADCFAHLQGDFAILIFDQKSENLYLARDRIGKKPLYWSQDEHNFLFGSELKALLATGIVPLTPARDAVAAYLYFGYIPQDMSPIKNVNKLLPAHYLEFNATGTLSIHSYWSYSSYFKNLKREPGVAQHLESLLSSSVKLNLECAQKNDPAVGCFVMGGLGSATIAGHLQNTPATCYSVGFQDQNEQDIAAAKEIAKTLELPCKSEMIAPEHCLDSLVKIVWHLDEPLADPNILATWQMAKRAAADTHSVFTGIGSDELLAGHTRYGHKPTFWQKLKNSFTSRFRHLLIPLLKVLWKPAAFSLLKTSSTNPYQFNYLTQNALYTKEQLAKAAPKLKGLFDPEIFLHKFQNLFKFQSNVSSYLYFDVKTRLPDHYLLQYERLTAAHGLDLYAPFLEQKLVEYLAGIDLNAPETAYLKEVLRKTYPEKIIDRPKFIRPQFLASWIDDPRIKEVFQLLTVGVLVENGLISKKWLHGALKNPPSFNHLWSILVLEIWYRLFIDQPITLTAPDITVKELLLK